MRIYSAKEFNWKDNQMYLDNKKTDISITPHQSHKGMYFITWTEGDSVEHSQDFYNLTIAKNNALRYKMRRLNREIEDGIYNSQETASTASLVRYSEEAARVVAT